MIYDPETLSRTGAWCEFRDKELAMLETSMQAIADGAQPIAKCELAMLPILLHHEQANIAGRDLIWMVDDTAALGGDIKGASGLAVSEHLIASFWMKAYALGIRLWIEHIDSKGNWSDGISRELQNDQYSRDNGFTTRALHQPLSWHIADIREAWTNASKPSWVGR